MHKLGWFAFIRSTAYCKPVEDCDLYIFSLHFWSLEQNQNQRLLLNERYTPNANGPPQPEYRWTFNRCTGCASNDMPLNINRLMLSWCACTFLCVVKPIPLVFYKPLNCGQNKSTPINVIKLSIFNKLDWIFRARDRVFVAYSLIFSIKSTWRT